MSLPVVANLAVVAFVAVALLLRRRRRALAAVVGVYFAWALTYFAVQGVAKSQRDQGVDFASYLVGARELLAGRDPYADFERFRLTREGPVAEILAAEGLELSPPVMYPPPFYVLISPLFRLPYAWAFAAWSALQTLFLVAAVWLGCLAFGLRDRLGRLAVLALALAANPTIDNIFEGQANILLALALAALAWAVARGKRPAAGLFAAAAILLKIFPVLILVYWAVRRQWRELATAAAALAVVAAAVAAAWGPGIWASYATLILVPGIKAAPTMGVNVSPVVMLAHAVPPGAPADVLVGATKLALLLFLAWLFVHLHKPRLEGAAEVALWVAAAMAASGWVTAPYCAVLLLPYVFLGRELWAGRLGRPAAALAVVSFVITYLRYDYRIWELMGWPHSIPMVIKPLGLLMLAAAMVAASLRARNAAPPAPARL